MKLTDPNRRGLLGQGSILSLTAAGHAHVAGLPRQVRPEHVPGHAAAAAAAERADARGEHKGSGRGAEDRARAARAAPHEPGVRRLPSSHRSGGLRARDTSTRSGSGATPATTARRSTRAASSQTAPRSMDPSHCGEAILKRPEAFATVLTERLMTYALGRGLEPSDMPVVRQIVRKAAHERLPSEHRSSTGSSKARRFRCGRAWSPEPSSTGPSNT